LRRVEGCLGVAQPAFLERLGEFEPALLLDQEVLREAAPFPCEASPIDGGTSLGGCGWAIEGRNTLAKRFEAALAGMQRALEWPDFKGHRLTLQCSLLAQLLP